MTEKHLILAIAAWWVLVALKAYIHVDLQRRGIDVHKGEQKSFWFGYNALGSLAHIMAFPINTEEDWPKVFVILFFQFLWHQVIFAPTHNKLNNREFTYLGAESGTFDRFFRDKPKLYVTFYIIYCTLAIVSIWLLNIIFRP